MERFELAVQMRNVVGKQVRRLRREGLIPAVIYGQDIEALPIQIDQYELRPALAEVGLSRLITLVVDDGATSHTALIREVQRDVLTDNILHVDFFQVQMLEKISTTIPLRLIGESQAVTQEAGVLLQGVVEVEIECLPGDLVDAIEVDISSLTELEQEITVADLVYPPGVEVLADPREMVVRVMTTYEEEEIEEEVSIFPAEVEVIGRPGREEEEPEEDTSVESF